LNTNALGNEVWKLDLKSSVPPTGYCASKGVAPWELWISNVRLGTLNNTSDKFKDINTTGFSDYTNLSTELVRGQSYPINVTPSLSWIGNLPHAYCHVWIDFNKNNVFETNELVLEKAGQNPLNQTFTVPANAPLGNTRMRVSLNWDSYPAACESFARGEVEDYTINLMDKGNNSCRTQDSLQLVQLYNTTHGANWLTQWNLNAPINTWHGVTLTPEGCVLRVELGNNLVSGTLTQLNLPNLELFALSGNTLTGNIPNFNFPKLKQLALNHNQFTGSIPNFNLPQLNVLSLEENQLTGAVPSFNLPNLTHLLCAVNQLAGPLPHFNLPEITTMDLHSNRITGQIPQFTTPKLMNLQLHLNQLTGAIPDLTLPNLVSLVLSDNQLSGCLPVSMKSFCGKSVDLSRNPNLAAQDFAAFCNSNAGSCTLSNNACKNYVTTNTNDRCGTAPTWKTYGLKLYNFTTGLFEFYQVDNAHLNVVGKKMVLTGTFRTATWQPIQVKAYFTAFPNKGYRGSACGTGIQDTTGWQFPVADSGKIVFPDKTLAISGLSFREGQMGIGANTQDLTVLGFYSLVGCANVNNPANSYNASFTFKLTNETICNAAAMNSKSILYDKVGALKPVDFNIFPNPTRQEAFLDLKDFENESVEIALFDIAGKAVLRQAIEKATAAPHRLDVSRLPNGAYRVCIQAVGAPVVTHPLYILN
jgi:hypothetical protein